MLALLGAHHFLHVSRIRVNLTRYRDNYNYRGGLACNEIWDPYAARKCLNNRGSVSFFKGLCFTGVIVWFFSVNLSTDNKLTYEPRRNPSSGWVTGNIPVIFWILQKRYNRFRRWEKNVSKLVCYTSVSQTMCHEQFLGVSREMWLFAKQFTSYSLKLSWQCRSLNAITSDLHLEVKKKALGSCTRESLAAVAPHSSWSDMT